MSHDLASLSDRNRVYFQDEGSQFVANAVIAERGFEFSTYARLRVEKRR
jgi:hypothetical protein